MPLIPQYDPGDAMPDFHAVVSITFGELYTDKWIDWTDPSWHWDAYDNAQYDRMCKKITEHFFDRELGVLPPLAWKREFLRKMNEIMPKYKPFYKLLEATPDALTHDLDQYGKNRNVFSDFPATQIAPAKQDYASNATDYEFENITVGNMYERLKDLKNYNDIDLQIINEIDSLFSCFYSVNISI